MNIRDTIGHGEWIGILIPHNPKTSVLVSIPINGTHPYERFGKHVIQDIYNDKRITYNIAYDQKMINEAEGIFNDVVHVHHNPEKRQFDAMLYR